MRATSKTIRREHGPEVWQPSFYERSPIVAIWELTRACDLACVHCRASATPERDPRELTTAEGLDLIEQLRELAPQVLVLTGGDPLKRPDLFRLIATSVRRGLRVAIAPSVTALLDRDVIARLAGEGVLRVALSLDGPEAATHDGFRRVPGSYAATLRAIEAVRTAGLSLQINTTLTRVTAPRFPDLSSLVGQLRPDLWSVFFVLPVGRAGADQQLSPDLCEEIFHWLYDWHVSTGLEVKTTAAPAFRRVVLQRNAMARRWNERRPLAVNDGNGFVFVSHTGEVHPSGFLPLPAGNVRDRRLAEIYRTSPLFRSLRSLERLEGKCAVCPFRPVCGGSRARAWATTGNPFAEDPSCLYVPPRARAEALT